MNKEKKIRIGSRKSELALIQTKKVVAMMQKLYPTIKYEIHTMSTIGDRVLNISLPKIGEKSLFTRDLEDALRNGGVDFVVHSLKDLPTSLPPGMAIGAVLEREDARDALVLRNEFKGSTLETLPEGSIIGTSSLRRAAQLRRQYPHLVVCDIRGNLNTRLAKLDATDSKYSGIILAYAGLLRMGWLNRISQVLESTDLLYAVGQGALAIECRANDENILTMVQSLMCLSTTCRILAERSFLNTLGGGCSAPVAVWSQLSGNILDLEANQENSLDLEGAVWSLDGTTELRDKISCSLEMEDSMIAIPNKVDITRDKDEPPPKRIRIQPDTEDSQKTPVINDDVNVVGIPSYDMQQLLKTHMDLAKKCPAMNPDKKNVLTDSEKITAKDNFMNAHCPLQIRVGQDFMGECPFVNEETKVLIASDDKCPFKGDTIDQTSFKIDSIATSSKCPVMGSSSKLSVEKYDINISDSSLSKCPFLQKTVPMIDYADEEKPSPNKVPKLNENNDNLFCGLYYHDCHNRELYIKAFQLGQTLAKNLIKKGALEIMHSAQLEIHSKAS